MPDFYAGPENALVAHLALGSMNLHELGSSCLIVGPSGVGKTAIARFLAAKELGEEAGGGRFLFEPATEFARRYAEAVEADDLEHFRQRYDRPDVLVIDDIQAIVGKHAAQVELSMRMDVRLEKQRLFIATCNVLPLQLRGLRAALASRLLGGLTVPIAPPGDEAREAILEALCLQLEFPFSIEQLRALDKSLPPRSTVRRLVSALQQVNLHRKASNVGKEETALSTEHIESAVRAAGIPTIASIAAAVAKRFKVRASDLRGDTRRQSVVQARALAMYLSRQLTDSSLQQIGRYFGGRDHSTVLHGLRKIEEGLPDQPELSRAIIELTDQLRS